MFIGVRISAGGQECGMSQTQMEMDKILDK